MRRRAPARGGRRTTLGGQAAGGRAATPASGQSGPAAPPARASPAPAGTTCQSWPVRSALSGYHGSPSTRANYHRHY
eukprot:985479-Prorocentrum_minimum.AAC.1